MSPKYQNNVLPELSVETPFRRTHKKLETRFLKIWFAECPVMTSLGILGKKWAFPILRDIAVYKVERFNQFLSSLPGITPKVLATRLRELERDGFIKKTVIKNNPPRIVQWSLTEKGIDTVPIGMMLAGFGAKWRADIVFSDKKPRMMNEIFTQEGMDFLKKYL